MDCPENLVSVIIPCYQQGRFLAQAIESVLAQSHGEYEIIVVDDGSMDNTAEVATRYPGLRYVRQVNRGTSSARNLGIRESRGNYLVFLDADDILLPHALRIGISALAERSDCAMTFGSCRYVDAGGSALPVYRRALDRDDYHLAFLRRCYVGHPAAAMFRRGIVDAGVVFDESLPMCSDYDFYLQVARKWPVCCHNETVSEYGSTASKSHPTGGEWSIRWLRSLKHRCLSRRAIQRTRGCSKRGSASSAMVIPERCWRERGKICVQPIGKIHGEISLTF